MIKKSTKNKLNVILNDKIIKLVPISLKYLMDFHEYSSDQRFYKYFEYKEFGSLKESKDYLQDLIKKSKKMISNHGSLFLKVKKNALAQSLL